MTDGDVTRDDDATREDADMPSAPPGFPRPFGAYLLLCPLAHGGMGEVFLASSRGIEGAVRLVVIKTLRPDLAKEPGYVTRFLDEARIVVQLQHTNICQVFDVGKQDGTHFFAMEHIGGTNVRRLVEELTDRGRAFPPGVALHVMAEALEGLAAAHRHRHPLTGQELHVVHRDVSPHNIMVSFEGDVKLIDFGLAASEMKREHTESQVVMGKIAYMSPEQARGEAVDASTDQFAAAIVLYELLVGERYYGDMNQREIWNTAGDPNYVPPRFGSLDDDVAAVLKRCFSSQREDRFPTCGDFAASLRDILKKRYPFVDRAMVKSFVRDVVAKELEESERNLRLLGASAIAATPAFQQVPRSNSGPHGTARTGAPSASGPWGLSGSSSAARASGEGGTGSTRTWFVFGRNRIRARSPWLPTLVAAAGGLALGAVGVLTALQLGAPDAPAPPPRASPPVLAAPAPPAPAPAPPAPDPAPAPTAAAAADAPVEPAEDAVEDSDDVAFEPVEPSAAPREPRKRVKRTTKKARPTAAARPWLSWSDEKKLAVIEGCSDNCARSIKNMKKKGLPVEGNTLEMCIEKCAR